MVQLLLLLAVCCPVLAESGAPADTPNATLHLLTLVPLAETAGLYPHPPCHGGEELISAAQMAVSKINMRDDILPDYKLELVPANTETCNQSLVTEALGNFVRHVTGGDLNIVGVVGLVCSTVTQAVSPLAGRPGIGLLHISAGAISPVFTNEEEYPHLYRMIPSSALYNDAVMELMATFQWRRISMVRDTILIQHKTTADDFVAKIEGRNESELVFLGEVSPTFPTSPVKSLLPNAARIIYASVTATEARELLCDSYQKDLRWPEFVWLFHDLSFEELMESTENCSNDTMLRAVEGVFLLQYRLQPNPYTTLISGQTYSEYLMELHNRTARTQEGIPYQPDDSRWPLHAGPRMCTKCCQHANALHDSIWAFALALNNLTSAELGSELDKSNVTTLVERNLKTVRFSGALGDIAFNDEREVVTIVDIFHVQEGKVIHVGHYNPLTGNVTVLLSPERIPKDDFEERDEIPRGFPVATLALAAVLLVFTTVVLVLFIYYWNKPSIRATSPSLSILILAGCYMLYIGCFFAGASEFIDFKFFGSLCLAQLWFCVIGMQTIYSALFMRLLRIYRIFFFIFKKPGKLWSNPAMFVFTFILVSPAVLLMTLWSALDPLVTMHLPSVFDPTSDPPQYIARLICNSKALIVWLSIALYGVNGVTVLAVAVLAILTRKVHLECFKDTKEVNAFVFSTFYCLCLWLSYLYVFTYLNFIGVASYIFSVYPYFVIPFLCKVFLFIPKIWSARNEKRRKPRRQPAMSFNGTQKCKI